jgi:hypothetical protein
MWCGFDENLVSKARVVQGSLLLTVFARVCGEFCSETSHIAAAHDARTASLQTNQLRQTSKFIFKPHILEKNMALFRRGY